MRSTDCKKLGGAPTKLTLKAARVNAGLTQQQVTDRTGIARSTLTRWEKGLTKPNKENLERLCYLYQISNNHVAQTQER